MWARPILLAGRVADFCCLTVPLCTKSRKKSSETSGCNRRTSSLLRSVMVCSHSNQIKSNQIYLLSSAPKPANDCVFLILPETAQESGGSSPTTQLLQFYVTVICPVLEYCTQPTGRHTPRYSVCNNRPQLRSKHSEV